MPEPVEGLPPTLGGLAEIAGLYDAFVLDQWGVLHDGGALYPGVSDCLRALAAQGKPVALLSNSGKRALSNRVRLAELGLPVDCLTAIVTSGEATRRAIAENALPFPMLGRRVLLFTRGGDRAIVDGLDLDLVEDPRAADAVLLAGTDMPHRPLQEYKRVLAEAARRGLPLVCANPDVTGVSPDGLIAAPGSLAVLYEEMGGRVQWVGKPDPLIYEVCLDAIGRPDPARILAVGDSLTHDIAGGNAAGMATLLIAGGIHGPDLAAEPDPRPPLARLIAEHGARPDYVLPTLRW